MSCRQPIGSQFLPDCSLPPFVGLCRLMLLIWLILWISLATEAQSNELHKLSNTTYLLDTLLSEENYDRKIRPGLGVNPVIIETNMEIRSFGPISESEMAYSMDCYFRQRWTDKRLQFHSHLEVLSMDWKFLQKVWIPDTFFLNGKSSYLHKVTAPNKFIRLGKDGSLQYSMRLTVKASCPMHLRKYPLDTQACPLEIGSYAYPSEDVVYKWTEPQAIKWSDDVKLSQYEFVRLSTSDRINIVKIGDRSDQRSILVVRFILKRRRGYFILQFYAPCAMIVGASWVSFWINRSDAAGRVAVGATTVLTMVTMGFGGKREKLGSATAIDWFIILCFTFVFSALAEYAFVNFIDNYEKRQVKKQLELDREKAKKEEAIENIAEPATVRHGFPFQPTAIAFDPVQRILAIATKNGSLRLFGRPGVDTCVQHDIDSAVVQILFLVNEGALITVCANDSVHLWNIRQKRPEVVHTLRFQKERITYTSLTFHSKWLYVGTERGNVHIVNVESFVLSGYVINWNKAVELSRKSHPGAVVHLSDNPVDPNKLLIGYESGTVALWDFRNKAVDCRFQSTESLKSASWHHEGRQFMCSYSDGSLKTWNIKNPSKPESIMYPHAKSTKEGNPEMCHAITKVEWKTARGSDSFIAFSGGMPFDKGNQNPCVTVIHGKTTTVLEMEHSIIDFITLCETPWPSDYQDPYAIVVLLYNDLVVIDLTSSGYPCYQNPYPMDLHESPVTSCSYFADCPNDLIPTLYSIGAKGKKNQCFSEKEWPIDGGGWGVSTLSYPEVIITGHADGSIKFWDASSVSLQILYKLKISRLFEKGKATDNHEDDPFAIERVAFCAESKILCVADASSHVIIFKFQQNETSCDVTILEIPVFYETDEDVDNTDNDPTVYQSQKTDGQNSTQPDGSKTICSYVPMKVKSGTIKKTPGFQADIVCMTPVINRDTPLHITSLTVNSIIGLMAYGSECGLAIVDMVQKCCVANMSTPDLYGSSDPYQRVPRSPKRTPVMLGENNCDQDKCRSPTADQVNGMCLSPTTRKHLLQRKPASAEMRRTKSQDKIDNSFSRSRSSSMSSLENITSEAVQYLIFAESYCRKSDFVTAPTLWVGTNVGSVLVVLLTLSPSSDQRYTQPVIVSPSGTVYRIKGSILSISFLDSSGSSSPCQFEAWKASENKTPSAEREKKKFVSGGQSKSKLSPTSSCDAHDSQLVLLCSEKQALIVSVPSQTCVQKVNLTETSFVVKAEVILLKDDKICLACYVASGTLAIFGLPSLRTVCTEDFLPLTDMRVARTFCFSKNGHGVYLCSPTELQKFSISSAYCDALQDMLGTLFVNKEIPEASKVSFFKGLFSTGPSMLDREELFGEASGKPSKNVASHVQNSTNIDQVKAQSGTLAGELAKVKQNLAERGEALSQLENQTEKMMSEAESFQSAARQLATKFKDKKWYQF